MIRGNPARRPPELRLFDSEQRATRGSACLSVEHRTVLQSTMTYPPGSDFVTPQDPNGNGNGTLVDDRLPVRHLASTIPSDSDDG